MKIKILLFPLIILVVFYLAVAHIFPDWQEAKKLKTEIAGNQLVVDSIRAQQKNVENLHGQILSDTQHKDDLEEIISKIRAEETIVSAAHQLAQKYQVILLQMTFDDEGTKVSRRNDPLAQAPQYANPDAVKIGVSVSGPYNNTKEFLDNFAKIVRGHTPESIEIDRSTGTTTGEETGNLEDQLDTVATYSYPYLEEINLQDSDMKTLQHGIQSQEQFNMTAIDEWIAMTNEDVANLNLGEHGRASSPFMP